MARVPNAPTPFVRIGLISISLSLDGLRHPALIEQSMQIPFYRGRLSTLTSLHQPSLTPKKPDPPQPLTNGLDHSGAHETATTAGDWRLSGSTTANRKLQRPLMKTARHSRPYCGNARLGLTCASRVKDRHPANHSSHRGPS